MFNPADMMKAMGAFNTFKQNHPKVVSFAKTVFSSEIPEGSVIEISVTKPGEDKVTTNMKVQQSDIELFKTLSSMQ